MWRDFGKPIDVGLTGRSFPFGRSGLIFGWPVNFLANGALQADLYDELAREREKYAAYTGHDADKDSGA